MSELWAFAQVGFQHIVAWDAADHILFLLVLAAIYRWRDWRSAMLVVSAFTIGHSITLALAVTNLLVLSPRIVEFLIPVTIVATGIENLAMRARAASGTGARHRPVFALLFGAIHGAGFAGYLRSLFVENIGVPLLGFNLGIEAGQVLVLAATAVVFVALDRALHRLPRKIASLDAFQMRLVTVSAMITVVASGWAWERLP
jgi:HupE / UreJ protein